MDKEKTIGVVGIGVMGTGVTQAFARAGFQVTAVDISAEILEAAKQKISQDIRFHKLFEKEKKQESKETILSRITFSTDYDILKECRLLIENVTENIEIKKGVYQRIDNICHETCIFGVNTSAISITKVASWTCRPAKVIGVHFMNPVPLKPMVEVIRGAHTSGETIAQVKNVLNEINKECIVVNDGPGFVTNRALMIFINEAVFTLQEQIAGVEDIDTLYKTCFGHKMGPLQTADLIGLDTVLHSLNVLYEGFNDPKYRPCNLLKKMVDAGWYGMKSGKGFYTYQSGGHNG